MNPWTRLHAPSLAQMAELAQAAFDALPAPIRQAAGQVELRLDEFADEPILADLGIEDAFELSGLYEGIDRLNQSVMDPTPSIARVFLFRRPILDEWAERGDVTLGELISHVLVHEIGHHMGLDDDAIAALEDEAD